MKKLLAVGFSSVLFLTACGSDETAKTADSSNGGTVPAESAETKKDFMKFYMSVPNTINEVDAELNTFEQQQAEGLLPEGDELAALKEAAGASAAEASDAVSGIQIPEALNSKEEELQSALGMIAESYEMKAAALTEEETSFEAADQKFIEADEIFNAILEENDLIPSSIHNEVK